VPDVRLPGTLTPLFPGLPRRLEIEAANVLGAIDQLEQRWPGLRDRLVAEGPSLRNHIHVYVDGERAALDTPVEERSRLDVIAAISGGCEPDLAVRPPYPILGESNQRAPSDARESTTI
jgi:sulfur-carrier protein